MKRTTVSVVLVACLVLVLLVVSAFGAASSVNAQLGNTGIPVKCTGHAVLNSLGNLICHEADGTPFANSGREVPSNHYLLVTDVTIFTNGPAYGYWEISIGKYSAAGYLDSITMATRTQATFSEHYGTPALVLSQGNFLGAVASGVSSGNADVYVYGLLTTTLSYLPLLTR